MFPVELKLGIKILYYGFLFIMHHLKDLNALRHIKQMRLKTILLELADVRMSVMTRFGVVI